MDTYQLPDAIEPDYWNVVFHPSETRLNKILLGRFQHVSAFTYVPGFRVWIIYDMQWRGMRIGLLSHPAAIGILTDYTKGCAVLKFSRRYDRLALLSRFGFYCVPAVKQLLGVSYCALRPDGLYRKMLANGGIEIHGTSDARLHQEQNNLRPA